MGIVLLLVIAAMVVTWYIFRNNYHIAIIKYLRLREDIKLYRKREVYDKKFQKEFRQYLKDTKKEKPYLQMYIFGALIAVLIGMWVYDYFFSTTRQLVNLVGLIWLGGVVACTGTTVNGWLAAMEATVAAHEKAFAYAVAKTQRIVPRRTTATQAGSAQAQPAAGGTSTPPRRRPRIVDTANNSGTPPAS